MMVLSEIVKSDYDKVDPEEIIIKLEEVLAFIQKKKQEGKL